MYHPTIGLAELFKLKIENANFIPLIYTLYHKKIQIIISTNQIYTPKGAMEFKIVLKRRNSSLKTQEE